MDACVARQPIFNEQKNLYAYELLFRDGVSNAAKFVDGDIATSTVLANSFFTIGIDKLTGGKRAFVNFPRKLLVEEIVTFFPKDLTVIEVLEDVEPDEAVIECCRKYSRDGYIIALDDFVFREEMRDLVELADIIKIDFMNTSIEEIDRYVQILPVDNIKLLAEKVETHEEFQAALDMGFELFQGYFFCKPEIVTSRDIPAASLSLLQLLAETNRKDFKFEKIEKTISQDVSLSYKLLRYINSAFFRRAKEISSIKQALVLLGQNEIRRFVSLLAMAKLGANKPEELLKNSSVRAKFCESICNISDCNVDADTLFTLGLFSNIDAILDQPMERILSELPFSEDISEALVNKRGKLYDFLRLVELYEKGNWEEFEDITEKLAVDESKVPGLYLEACQWSDALTTL